jgi:hypothetical protein
MAHLPPLTGADVPTNLGPSAIAALTAGTAAGVAAGPGSSVASPSRTTSQATLIGWLLPSATVTPPRIRMIADDDALYIDALRHLPRAISPTQLHSRRPPPGFTLTTLAPMTPAVDPALVTTIAMIQATVAASQERERAASLALEQERALGAALTTLMATAQRLLVGRPSVAREDPR